MADAQLCDVLLIGVAQLLQRIDHERGATAYEQHEQQPGHEAAS